MNAIRRTVFTALAAAIFGLVGAVTSGHDAQAEEVIFTEPIYVIAARAPGAAQAAALPVEHVIFEEPLRIVIPRASKLLLGQASRLDQSVVILVHH